ncbi:hypothetical protein D3C85_1247070 [compost metagenome]
MADLFKMSTEIPSVRRSVIELPGHSNMLGTLAGKAQSNGRLVPRLDSPLATQGRPHVCTKVLSVCCYADSQAQRMGLTRQMQSKRRLSNVLCRSVIQNL